MDKQISHENTTGSVVISASQPGQLGALLSIGL